MERQYNFALIPPRDVSARAVEMSQALSAGGTAYFTLDNQSLFPHVSLYHVTLESDTLDAAIADVAAMLRSFSVFPLVQGPYRAVGDEWIDVSYECSPDLSALHAAIINSAKHHRVGQGEETRLPDWNELSDEQRANMLVCGWTEAFGLFRPHLTFTRLKAKRPDMLVTLPRRDFAFLATRVGLFERGTHGTCTRLIHVFELTHD